jgi:hypothetical protein
MKAKAALIGSVVGGLALVGFVSDASALTRHWKSTSCGPSATVIKHNRYGFVDPGVRSRTVIRERGGAARFGVNVREGGARFGLREHGRAGINANDNIRERSGGGDRAGAQLQGNRAGGANVTTGRSGAGAGGNMSSQTGAGGGGAGAAKTSGGATSPAGGGGGAGGGGSMSGGGGGGAGTSR